MINATLLQCNGRALYYASHGDFKDKNLMCGFSGFLTLKADLDDSPGLLRRMGDAIYHRGPDDNGEWFDGNAGIGFSHRRLAIIDVSAAGINRWLHPATGMSLPLTVKSIITWNFEAVWLMKGVAFAGLGTLIPKHC